MTDTLVPNETVWLDGPRASATQVGVRGYRYPPYESPGSGSAIDAYALILYVAGRTSIHRVIGAHDERCDVGPGDLSLQPPLVASRWGWQSPIDVLHVYVDPAYMREIAQEESHTPVALKMRHSLRVNDDALVQMGVDLIEELRPPRPLASERSARAIGERMAIHLLRNYFDIEPAREAARGLSAPEIAALRGFVAERLGDGVRLADLARVVGLGVHHFCRVFRDTFGKSPHDYIASERLDRARELLFKTSKPVAEIAMLTGFADQSHLTRSFKRRFGAPPAQLRRRERAPG
jgi:AraC family transcriptional regulator